MKKVLIILGIVIVLLAGAAWTYVFLFGVPENANEVFGRFTEAPERPGSTGTDGGGTVDVGSGDDENEYEGEDARDRLYQLTTRPVAGAAIVGDAVRYVERGTGHIYEIALTGGGERIISGTTIPRTIRALFSSSGDGVALTSEYEQELISVLGTLTRTTGGDGGLTITELPTGATEIGFDTKTGALLFFVPTANGGTAYSYDPVAERTTEVFSIPLSQVRVLWGAPTYVYTTPSAYAMGYVYRVGKTGLEYVTEGGKGLMALRYATGTMVTTVADRVVTTRDVVTGGVPYPTLFPEKCTTQGPVGRILFCAVPFTFDNSAQYPDDWYKGVSSFSDMIVRIDAPSSTVSVLSNLEDESGRPIDVSDIGTDETGRLVHFINKLDGTLWMLDLR